MPHSASHRDAAGSNAQGPRLPRFDLGVISFLVLFLELACIRWFPAHVPYLTYFTNMVLLACFLGTSAGCLAAGRPLRFLTWTPIVLLVALAAAHGVEHLHHVYQAAGGAASDAGAPRGPFGISTVFRDPLRFFIRIEVLGAFFFLAIALALVGLGQELGRAFAQAPDRIQAYTLNIVGSLAGIVAFAVCSWCEWPPAVWFAPVVAGLAYLLRARPPRPSAAAQAGLAAALAGMLVLSSWDVGVAAPGESGVHANLWSPYYRILYYDAPSRLIDVNLFSHQKMVARRESYLPGYALPYLLRRDAGGGPVEDVLIIGAGSGNDVSQSLQWGVRRVDAVEIDPVIQKLGRLHHPDRPYADPRVAVHVDDGRNFLRSTDRTYDFVIYALVDSLVLHSSYSSIRLENYLFTRQAFADVRRRLKPGGLFVLYNYFDYGWLIARLDQDLRDTFGSAPVVLTVPYQARVDPGGPVPYTIILVGATEGVAESFRREPFYRLRNDRPLGADTPDGFAERPPPGEEARWERFGRAEVGTQENARPLTDDWPFLHIPSPMLPPLTVRSMGIMGVLALGLLWALSPRGGAGGAPGRWNRQMFFLGAGFMLVETKAVVHMGLLFGSTWMVNTVIFFAVLVMILAANVFVLKFRPQRQRPYYAGLAASLALGAAIPMDAFLGMDRVVQVALASLLTFAPILFAGVLFAVAFGRSANPDRDLGANIAGAMLGGLVENTSMLVGFRYLGVAALLLYGLSIARLRPLPAPAGLEPPGGGAARGPAA